MCSLVKPSQFVNPLIYELRNKTGWRSFLLSISSKDMLQNRQHLSAKRDDEETNCNTPYRTILANEQLGFSSVVHGRMRTIHWLCEFFESPDNCSFVRSYMKRAIVKWNCFSVWTLFFNPADPRGITSVSYTHLTLPTTTIHLV